MKVMTAWAGFAAAGGVWAGAASAIGAGFSAIVGGARIMLDFQQSASAPKSPSLPRPSALRAAVLRPDTRPVRADRAEKDAATQYLARRPRRARAFRHLWRPLCGRNLDAADPVAGARLLGRQGRPRLRRRAVRLSQEFRRPAEPALFRATADRTSGWRPHLPQARGPQPHRRA